jgi:hypothetical protein
LPEFGDDDYCAGHGSGRGQGRGQGTGCCH